MNFKDKTGKNKKYKSYKDYYSDEWTDFKKRI